MRAEETGNGEETRSSDVLPDEDVDDVLDTKLAIAQAAYNGTDVLTMPAAGKLQGKTNGNDFASDPAEKRSLNGRGGTP